MHRTFTSYVLLLTGFLACPCHLPLTLPLIIGLFGGTALGVWIRVHTSLVIGLSASYFIAALAIGFWLLNRRTTRAGHTLEDGAACPRTARRDDGAYVKGSP